MRWYSKIYVNICPPMRITLWRWLRTRMTLSSVFGTREHTHTHTHTHTNTHVDEISYLDELIAAKHAKIHLRMRIRYENNFRWRDLLRCTQAPQETSGERSAFKCSTYWDIRQLPFAHAYHAKMMTPDENTTASVVSDGLENTCKR